MTAATQAKAGEWRIRLGWLVAGAALSAATPAWAQSTAPPEASGAVGASGAAATSRALGPQRIAWSVDVLQDGQPVDHFSGVTSVNQARTMTHHHPTSHTIGCGSQAAVDIDLKRSLTVAPISEDAEAISISIDANEILEDTGRARADACDHLPTPRTLGAHHPDLRVPAGGSADWTVLAEHPKLVYRVSAQLTDAEPSD